MSDSSIQQYKIYVQSFPSLVKEEEEDLVSSLQYGNKAAREKLFNHCLKKIPLNIYKLMPKSWYGSDKYWDLIQAGHEALGKALDKVEEGHFQIADAKFSTYASKYIYYGILDEIKFLQRLIKVPGRDSIPVISLHAPIGEDGYLIDMLANTTKKSEEIYEIPKLDKPQSIMNEKPGSDDKNLLELEILIHFIKLQTILGRRMKRLINKGIKSCSKEELAKYLGYDSEEFEINFKRPLFAQSCFYDPVQKSLFRDYVNNDFLIYAYELKLAGKAEDEIRQELIEKYGKSYKKVQPLFSRVNKEIRRLYMFQEEFYKLFEQTDSPLDLYSSHKNEIDSTLYRFYSDMIANQMIKILDLSSETRNIHEVARRCNISRILVIKRLEDAFRIISPLHYYYLRHGRPGFMQQGTFS